MPDYTQKKGLFNCFIAQLQGYKPTIDGCTFQTEKIFHVVTRAPFV